jgi:ribosomal protein L11 methyltransferase
VTFRELRIVVPRAHIDRTSALFFEHGTTGIQEDHLPGQVPVPRQPWDVGPVAPPSPEALLRAWFEAPDVAAIEAALAEALGPTAAPRWEDVPDVAWDTAWQANFPRIQASPRIVVAPPWDAPPGAVVIDPGQGFGTGQHPSTVAALRAIDTLADQATTLLDVGCGSGILTLAAARLGVTSRGIDNDAVAVADARGNAERNGLLVTFETTPLCDIPERADLVVANLFAEVLVDNAHDLVRVTGRWLVLAGILADREAQVRRAFDARFPRVERVVDGEWVALVYETP